MQTMPASRIRLRSLAKMPTTSVRRPTSLLKRSSGLVERSLRQCRGGEGVKGQDHRFGVFEHRGDPAEAPVEMRDGLREPITRLSQRVAVEDRPDQRAQQAVLILAGVSEAIAE